MVLCNRNGRTIYGICAWASSILAEIIMSELMPFVGNISLKTSRPSARTDVMEENILLQVSFVRFHCLRIN